MTDGSKLTTDELLTEMWEYFRSQHVRLPPKANPTLVSALLHKVRLVYIAGLQEGIQLAANIAEIEDHRKDALRAMQAIGHGAEVWLRDNREPELQ